MDLHYFPCFEVESYYIDNKGHESFHYHGNMNVDLANIVHLGQDGKIWPFQKIAKYEEISGQLNNISGICATSYPSKCYLDMHSLEKSHFNLNIKEAFGSDSETNYTLSIHVDLHFDLNNSNQEVKTFSDKDKNGNSFFLKLKESKCK
ncbi:hypothetical protein [Candidatus Mesenet endosymbiont of Agriotes lineatus]|uniref:hypothetical protein n=1 Tax=Candidatus Mesenet endosymbiont of Agriotes lineatus TaxID=3077948 RepID=UPI0030D1E1AA